MKNTILERFLKYTAINTRSDDESTQTPSTLGQFDLARVVESELKSYGAMRCCVRRKVLFDGNVAY